MTNPRMTSRSDLSTAIAGDRGPGVCSLSRQAIFQPFATFHYYMGLLPAPLTRG